MGWPFFENVPQKIYKVVSIGIILFCLSNEDLAFANEMVRDYRSAAYLGRGDTGIALAEGIDAVFYNPAGISQGSGTFKEFALVSPQITASSNIKGLYDRSNGSTSEVVNYVLSNQNKPFYMSAQNATGVVFKRFALVAMQSGSASAIVGINPYTGIPYVDFDAVVRNGAYLTLSKDFFREHLLLGITAKFVQKRESSIQLTALDAETTLNHVGFKDLLYKNEKRGNALGADIGTTLVLDKESRTQISAVYRNLGMNYRWSVPEGGPAPSSEPTSVDAGVSTSFGTKKSRFKLLADYRDFTNYAGENTYKHTHFGIEYCLLNTISIMAGLNQGYPTYGAALRFKIIRIEGGMYSEEIGSLPGDQENQRYFARVSLGWLI